MVACDFLLVICSECKPIFYHSRHILCVHEKNAPLSINPQYSNYWANISEIFTTEFITYLYIVCINSWKFKVKILYYYMFSIICPKHKFP